MNTLNLIGVVLCTLGSIMGFAQGNNLAGIWAATAAIWAIA